ncbi:MAG: hypothetical protein HDQ98_05020 [Lachnospiraceae bacterium]|nr:hypothetical protein [Lachnospiraceae bacterium]
MKACWKSRIKEQDPLRTASWVVYLLMLLLQVRLVVCFSGEQFGDFMEYVNKAKEISAARAFYPRVQDLQRVFYLHAPGYVNFLALVFRLTDNLKVVFCLNILFLQILLFSAKDIVYRLTGKRRCAEVFQILYCIYFSLGVGGGVVLANTEMPFCALVFLSMALAMAKKREVLTMAAAGFIMGLANWIRPVMILFLPAVLWGIYQTDKRKMLRRTVCYCASMMACILCIGGLSYLNCGKFVYQSTTMGINLFIGNNPIADGNNHWDAVLKQNADPAAAADWTYEEWEDYYLYEALSWMRENPGKVIKLMPNRLFYLWANDVYFATAYTDNKVDTEKTAYIISVIDKVRNLQLGELKGIDLMVILTECYYLFVLILAAVGAVRQIRGKEWSVWLGIYSIVILGTGMLMLMFGYGRFHFPYMIAILMIAQGAFGRTDMQIGTNKRIDEETV